MYKIPARTHFAGKNLVYVPQCHSTNTLAAELSQKAETPEGTVVVTDFQMAGRGQRGNTWESEPGKNLMFSLILRPRFLAAKDQFQLNEAVSVGIADFISGQLTQKVTIKWPNDILISEKKVCGILIENHINGDSLSYSIIGIGLNMNQQQFNDPKAGSLKLFSGKDYQLNNEFETLLHDIEERYLELRHGKSAELETDYLNFLYRNGEIHQFIVDGETIEGIITGINEDGKLLLNVGGAIRKFAAKEIRFV